MMRLAMIVMAAAFAASFTTSNPANAAAQWPWCAQYTGKGGSTNCGFASWRQCQLAVSGVGGWCYENPYYLFEEPRRRGGRRNY
jgi:hypothetical protein